LSYLIDTKVISELRKRERGHPADGAQAAALDRWLDQLRAGLGARILPVDERVAAVWGRPGIPDALPAIDGLIAATALVHGLTVVTRNIGDLVRAGAMVINPFSSRA
jgi:predicted nucleic acid-binding protein